MRVISGKAGNMKLLAPQGLNTRPITDQIKEALFNIWQFKVEDCRFLDLFSGSGAVAIEAMSRGCAKAVMVDKSQQAVSIIRKNIANCHLEDVDHQIMKQDVFSAVAFLEESGQRFDLIYVDPPFTVDEIFDPVMEALGKTELLEEDGTLAIRTLTSRKMQEQYGHLVKTREKKYGLSTIHFYRNEELFPGE